MERATKRSIAKEVVIFFSCLVLIGLTWTALWLKNNYAIRQADKLDIQVKAQVKKLTSGIDSIHLILGRKTITAPSTSEIDPIKKKVPRPSEVFGIQLHDSNCFAYKKRIEYVKSELATSKSKIYSANDLAEITIWISVVIMALGYPVRFLLLLLFWAVKTLNQKE